MNVPNKTIAHCNLGFSYSASVSCSAVQAKIIAQLLFFCPAGQCAHLDRSLNTVYLITIKLI